MKNLLFIIVYFLVSLLSIGNTYFIWNCLLTTIPELHIPTLSFKSAVLLYICIDMIIEIRKRFFVSAEVNLTYSFIVNILVFVVANLIYYTLIV